MWVNYLLDCVAVMSAAHQPQTDYAATSPTVREAIHWYTSLHNLHGLWRSRTGGMIWRNIRAAQRWKELGGDPHGVDPWSTGGRESASAKRSAGSGGGSDSATAPVSYPARVPEDPTCPGLGCTLEDLEGEPCLVSGKGWSPIRDADLRKSTVLLVGDSGTLKYLQASSTGIAEHLRRDCGWTNLKQNGGHDTHEKWAKELREFREDKASAR